jgi:hypothetical protein
MMSDALPDFDLFGGEYVLPSDARLLGHVFFRLTPGQKRRFFDYAASLGKTPTSVLREFVLSLVGDF